MMLFSNNHYFTLTLNWMVKFCAPGTTTVWVLKTLLITRKRKLRKRLEWKSKEVAPCVPWCTVMCGVNGTVISSVKSFPFPRNPLCFISSYVCLGSFEYTAFIVPLWWRVCKCTSLHTLIKTDIFFKCLTIKTNNKFIVYCIFCSSCDG